MSEWIIHNFQNGTLVHKIELHGIAWTYFCAELCLNLCYTVWMKKKKDMTGEIKHGLFWAMGIMQVLEGKKKDPKYGWGNACDRDNAERSAVTHQVFSIGMVEGPQGFLSLCIGLLRASTIHVEVLTSAQRWHLIRAAELVASWRLKIFRNPKDW